MSWDATDQIPLVLSREVIAALERMLASRPSDQHTVPLQAALKAALKAYDVEHGNPVAEDVQAVAPTTGSSARGSIEPEPVPTSFVTEVRPELAGSGQRPTRRIEPDPAAGMVPADELIGLMG